MTIELKGVSVVYPLPRGGELRAVDSVDLTVANGDILGLLGSSGSGKSTLLRVIAGLEPATEGSVWIDGRDITNVPTHKRNVGMVFQRGELFPHRTVGRNIAYGLEMAGVDKAERLKTVTELLELVGLAGYEDRDVSTLSGGQAQRVALARSLAPKPDVLLLDEPLSALDVELRERLAIDVREILKASGTTAIYVTHDPEEARTVADHMARIEAGKLTLTPVGSAANRQSEQPAPPSTTAAPREPGQVDQ